jgi:hypothetical protein
MLSLAADAIFANAKTNTGDTKVSKASLPNDNIITLLAVGLVFSIEVVYRDFQISDSSHFIRPCFFAKFGDRKRPPMCSNKSDEEPILRNPCFSFMISYY